MKSTESRPYILISRHLDIESFPTEDLLGWPPYSKGNPCASSVLQGKSGASLDQPSPYSEGRRPYWKGRVAGIEGKQARSAREAEPYSEGNPTVPEGKSTTTLANEFGPKSKRPPQTSPCSTSFDVRTHVLSQQHVVGVIGIRATLCWRRLAGTPYFMENTLAHRINAQSDAL